MYNSFTCSCFILWIFSSYDIICKLISSSKTWELLLLFVISRLCSFSGYLISGAYDDGKGKFLKLLKTDSQLLLHKFALSCFDDPCFVFAEIDCPELLVLPVYVKDLFEPATAGTKSSTFNFAL